ncbi:MAG: AMP-binding protein [Mailhella sp.]|nr:AMP-binding protein [Mailhella sp.]
MSSFFLQDHTLGQMLDEAVRLCPDHDALLYVGRGYRQTWKEFAETVDMLGRGLMALGVQPGEKIALWATNVPYWVAMLFAAARIGAVLLAVNTNYRDSELERLIQQSECENFVCIDGFLDYDYVAALNRVVPDLKDQPAGDVHSVKFPRLRRVMSLKDIEHPGIIPLSGIFSRAGDTSQEEYEARKALVHPGDVVNMQYTSGTTGFPKGVMLTHAGIVRNGFGIGERMSLCSGDRVVIPVPLFHCFGIVLGVMACVSHCSAMIILESFSPEKVMSSVQDEKATVLYGVPSNFTAILGHRRFGQYDFSSLRAILMSGSVCPEPLMREVLSAMGVDEIYTPYGLTEASPVITMTRKGDSDEHRFKTVGCRLDGIEVELRDAQGLPVPAGVQGEICCRGYNVMKGYYNMPEETAEVIDKDGWLKSGDLGVMDEEGYLRITGRIKDMIVRGGENIYPREVEEELLQMPGIADVQVVGIPSRRYGEDVAAFIIPKAGCVVQAGDVREFCRGRVAWHKIPRYIASVAEFPKTANGKIQKNRLRVMAEELFPHVK